MTDPTKVLMGDDAAKQLQKRVIVQWLTENFEPKKGTTIEKSALYQEYLGMCKKHNLSPTTPSAFGRFVSMAFPGRKSCKRGAKGTVKHHYKDIQRKRFKRSFRKTGKSFSSSKRSPPVSPLPSSATYTEDEPSSGDSPRDGTRSGRDTPSEKYSPPSTSPPSRSSLTHGFSSSSASSSCASSLHTSPRFSSISSLPYSSSSTSSSASTSSSLASSMEQQANLKITSTVARAFYDDRFSLPRCASAPPSCRVLSHPMEPCSSLTSNYDVPYSASCHLWGQSVYGNAYAHCLQKQPPPPSPSSSFASSPSFRARSGPAFERKLMRCWSLPSEQYTPTTSVQATRSGVSTNTLPPPPSSGYCRCTEHCGDATNRQQRPKFAPDGHSMPYPYFRTPSPGRSSSFSLHREHSQQGYVGHESMPELIVRPGGGSPGHEGYVGGAEDQLYHPMDRPSPYGPSWLVCRAEEPPPYRDVPVAAGDEDECQWVAWDDPASHEPICGPQAKRPFALQDTRAYPGGAVPLETQPFGVVKAASPDAKASPPAPHPHPDTRHLVPSVNVSSSAAHRHCRQEEEFEEDTTTTQRQESLLWPEYTGREEEPPYPFLSLYTDAEFAWF
ncbi:Transcription factor rfx3 [Balamuthia mandrillaris]